MIYSLTWKYPQGHLIVRFITPMIKLSKEDRNSFEVKLVTSLVVFELCGRRIGFSALTKTVTPSISELNRLVCSKRYSLNIISDISEPIPG